MLSGRLKTNIFKRIAAAVIAVMLLAVFGCSADVTEKPDDTSMPNSTKGQETPSPAPEVPKSGGTLKLSVGPYDIIDPLRTSNEDVRLFMCTFVCENLIDIDSNMLPVPRILTSWVCDETYKVWEFKVAQDVVFHSGYKAEAADVRDLINNIIGFGGNYSSNVKNVAGCFAKDKETVQVILAKPDALFVNKLSIPLVGWKTVTSDRPIVMDGTGVFKTTEFDGDHILLEKNTLYRDKSKLTYYNTVDITVYESENAKTLSDSDICVLQGASVGSNLLREGSTVYYYGGTGYDFIALNCASTYLLGSAGDSMTGEDKNYITLANPLSDKRLRQVINLITSRENAVRAAASDHGKIALMPLYSGTAYRKQLKADYDYSPERAISLLREIGYVKTDDGWFMDDEELIVRGICPRYNFRMLAVMREAATALKSIGVRVEIAELTDAEYLERLNNREYMIAAVETELGVWQDCRDILGTLGSLNYSFYSDARVDGYLEQIALHSDPAVVSAAYSKIEEIVLEDCPIAGLFIADNAVIVSKRVKGVREEVLRPWSPLADALNWWID